MRRTSLVLTGFHVPLTRHLEGFSSYPAFDSHRWCRSLAVLRASVLDSISLRWTGSLEYGNFQCTRKYPRRTDPPTGLINLCLRARTFIKLVYFQLHGDDVPSSLMFLIFNPMSTRLKDDVLITHCASWLGHVNDDTQNPEFQEFPGTLTLWKWLGLHRFFPEGKEIQENSRGCAAVSSGLIHRNFVLTETGL